MKEAGRNEEREEESGGAPCVLEGKGEPLCTHQQGIPTLLQPQHGLSRNVTVTVWRECSSHPSWASRVCLQMSADVAAGQWRSWRGWRQYHDATDTIAFRGLGVSDGCRATLAIKRRTKKRVWAQTQVSDRAPPLPTPGASGDVGRGPEDDKFLLFKPKNSIK